MQMMVGMIKKRSLDEKSMIKKTSLDEKSIRGREGGRTYLYLLIACFAIASSVIR